MGSLTYPFSVPTGTLTADDVHRILNSPNLIAKRVQKLASQKFIADYLLGGRFTATAGGVFYDETGDVIFADDAPRAVAPGAEYPLTLMNQGPMAAAKTVKWGLDSEFYDERIAAMGIQPVDAGLNRMVNSTIKNVDGVALAVIASKVTATFASPSAWTTGAGIVEGVLAAKAVGDNQGNGGYDLSTVVLKPAAYAKVIAYLINGGLLPRETANVVAGASIPVDALGQTWAQSPYTPFSDPILCDRSQLGGMADQDLKSPGYVRGANGVGVETKVWRLTGDSDRDGYRGRCRRVTVPVVTDPMAGLRITGTGI